MAMTYSVFFYDRAAKRWRKRSGLTYREAVVVARTYRAMGMDADISAD